jgi:hypothetical protein
MLDHLSGATRLFPIIGDPIKYVESPVHLTRSFGVRGHNAVCVPMQVPGPALDAVMRGLSATPNVDGLLVTMPHKRTVFGHCATNSERATLLGVISVLRRNAARRRGASGPTASARAKVALVWFRPHRPHRRPGPPVLRRRIGPVRRARHGGMQTKSDAAIPSMPDRLRCLFCEHCMVAVIGTLVSRDSISFT